MLRWVALLGILGLAAATALIVWSGWQPVMQALTQAGWGIVAVALFHLMPLAISGLGWQMLVPGRRRPSGLMFIYFMWIRASVNNLMPVARIGGEFAAVRVMRAHGMRLNTAIAATVVELTLSIVAVFIFVSLGTVLFVHHIGHGDVSRALFWALAISVPVIAAMIMAQSGGLFTLLARLCRLLFRDKFAQIAGGAGRLDRAVATMYLRHGRALGCGAMQLAAWVLGSLDIALSLYFLNYDLPLVQCVMIEALIQGSASAAFAIPGALGVQEAGFVAFGGLLGIPHEIAAALAIMRRCRDVLCYVPGLIVWQAHEGRQLFKGKGKRKG